MHGSSLQLELDVPEMVLGEGIGKAMNTSAAQLVGCTGAPKALTGQAGKGGTGRNGTRRLTKRHVHITDRGVHVGPHCQALKGGKWKGGRNGGSPRQQTFFALQQSYCYNAGNIENIKKILIDSTPLESTASQLKSVPLELHLR